MFQKMLILMTAMLVLPGVDADPQAGQSQGDAQAQEQAQTSVEAEIEAQVEAELRKQENAEGAQVDAATPEITPEAREAAQAKAEQFAPPIEEEPASTEEPAPADEAAPKEEEKEIRLVLDRELGIYRVDGEANTFYVDGEYFRLHNRWLVHAASPHSGVWRVVSADSIPDPLAGLTGEPGR